MVQQNSIFLLTMSVRKRSLSLSLSLSLFLFRRYDYSQLYAYIFGHLGIKVSQYICFSVTVTVIACSKQISWKLKRQRFEKKALKNRRKKKNRKRQWMIYNRKKKKDRGKLFAFASQFPLQVYGRQPKSQTNWKLILKWSELESTVCVGSYGKRRWRTPFIYIECYNFY